MSNSFCSAENSGAPRTDIRLDRFLWNSGGGRQLIPVEGICMESTRIETHVCIGSNCTSNAPIVEEKQQAFALATRKSDRKDFSSHFNN